MRWRVGIVALALAVVGCGGGSSSGAAPAPAPSESDTGSVAPGSYESIRAMQLDVEAAFVLCNAPLQVYDPPLVEGAVEQADCKRDVGLLIFEPTDVQAGVAAVQAEADDGLTLLVGNNWIVTCYTEGTCEKIQGVAGGELIATG